eukprot:scaffold3437_cov31-Tisochrysis_lutea.AAC.1
MPPLYLYSDHDELSQDERSEGDPDHMHETLLKEHDASQHDDTALIEGLPGPHKEGLDGQVAALLELAVQLGELQGVQF